MDFYGVGVRFGGKGENSILANCIKYNCWYMGFSQGDKEKYDELIEKAECGDIVFAKSYLLGNHQRDVEMRIEAIGIITGKGLPECISKDYKMGFSVSWVKVFDEPVSLTTSEITLGGRKPDTIYHEKDENMNKLILNMMKYDYVGEAEQMKSVDLPINDYIEIAQTFILDEVYSNFEEEEITEYPDDEIEIVAQDQFGRKIICVPFEAAGTEEYGLILLVPEKSWQDDEICLSNHGIEILDNDEDIPGVIERLKLKTDWNKMLIC